MGEPPNSVSFHLRQLARYGLIEPNPEHSGDRRERWWRHASDQGFHIDLEAIAQQPGGDAAVATIRRVAEGHVVALHRAIRAQGPADPAKGGLPRAINRDFAVWLGEGELAQMRAELEEVLDRWSDLSRSRAEQDGQRRGYYGVVLAAPEDG